MTGGRVSSRAAVRTTDRPSVRDDMTAGDSTAIVDNLLRVPAARSGQTAVPTRDVYRGN